MQGTSNDMYISYEGAKKLLKQFYIYRQRMNGATLKDLALANDVDERTIRRYIHRINKLIEEKRLGIVIKYAQDAVAEEVWRSALYAREQLPVRCSSGCRFSPL